MDRYLFIYIIYIKYYRTTNIIYNIIYDFVKGGLYESYTYLWTQKLRVKYKFRQDTGSESSLIILNRIDLELYQIYAKFYPNIFKNSTCILYTYKVYMARQTSLDRLRKVILSRTVYFKIDVRRFFLYVMKVVSTF